MKEIPGYRIVIGLFCAIFVCLFLLGKGPKGAYRTYVKAGENIVHHISPYSPGDFSKGFKYSPLFALLACPFYVFSFNSGGGLWQLLNFAVFSIGLSVFITHIYMEKGPVSTLLNRPYKLLILLLLVSNELLGSLMHGQINAMICGMMLLGLVFYSRGYLIHAGIILALASNFKLFPLCLALLFLWDFKLKYWISFWAFLILSFFLPALAIGWQWNLELLQTWHTVLTTDYVFSGSLSLLQFLRKFFDFKWDAAYYGFMGLNVFFLCAGFRFFYSKDKSKGAKLLYPLVALFILLFNHRSEAVLFVFASPIFAMMYLIIEEKRSRGFSAITETILLFAGYFCISIAYSDLVPDSVAIWFSDHHMRTFGAFILYVYFIREAVMLCFITQPYKQPSMGN